MKRTYLFMALMGLMAACFSSSGSVWGQAGAGSSTSLPAPESTPANTPEKAGEVRMLPPSLTTDKTVLSPGPVATPDNPTSRQEPAVTLEWVGPATAQVGKPADYTLAVRNASNAAVQSVSVHVRVSDSTAIMDKDGHAIVGNTMTFELGALQPKERRNSQIRLVPGVGGEVNCAAWVTFTGSSSIRVPVRQPMLEMKATGPTKDVLIGETAGFIFTVSNPGSMETESVKLQATVADGLDHPNGKQMEFDLGTMAAGEKRTVQLICFTKAVGQQRCNGVVVAGGGLRAEDGASVNVVSPKLDLEVVGPPFRYLTRKGTYSMKVTNSGTGVAHHLTMTDVLPAGFKFLCASNGGEHDFATRTVSWRLGELAPGKTQQVQMELQAVNPGEFNQKVTIQAAHGSKAEQELMTHVEGISALLVEVVDLEDPVAIGDETVYEIRVTNTGSKSEPNVKITCRIPEQMEFKVASGPSLYRVDGKTIVFEPIAKLPPKADAIYRVSLKTVATGDARFRAEVTGLTLSEAVVETEATRIFADQPDQK